MAMNNGNNVDHQENLLFQEHGFLRSFDREFNHSPDLIEPSTGPLIRWLLTKENNGLFDPPEIIPQSEKSWIKLYRLWMLKEVVFKSVDDFGLQRYKTAYNAMIYFERVLSMTWMILKPNDLAIKLMGVACLLTAADVEEGSLPPFLPFLDGWIVQSIVDMERAVRTVLRGWLLAVTPWDFTNFFMIHFETFPAGNGGNMASRTAAFVFAAAKVIGTLEYRPSVVAAAATLAAMDQNLTRAGIQEWISRSRVSHFRFTAAAEDVHRCYSLINKLDPYQELVIPQL